MPAGSPAIALAALAAEVTTVGMPAAVAISAESTLVDMPPRPTPLAPALPARTAARSCGPVTMSTLLAPPLRGSPS